MIVSIGGQDLHNVRTFRLHVWYIAHVQ